MKKREQLVSLAGVIALALVLPMVLRLSNSVLRYVVGAEGRLAAITVDTNRPLGPLPKPWQGLAQGGENLTGFLDGNISAVTAVKPTFIRIDHIYDQFGVVNRSGNQLILKWDVLDKTVNQIRQTGATPFLVLSYMPEAISTGKETDEPTDWNDWAMLVRKTIEHYSGEMKIPGIYYEVWNEPDLFGKWKIGGKKDYRTLYYYSSKGATTATNVLDFKLGGPATTGLYENWISDFLTYVVQNRLRLDFVSWHRYDLRPEKYAEDVANVDKWLERHPNFSRVEKIVTEMGPISDPGKENDQTTGAAHLVAVMRELLHKIHYGFSFSVTGQWGVIGKPRYESLKLLTALGDQRLSITGEGSWVRAIGAVKNGVFQVLVVNYDTKGTHSEMVPVTFINLAGGEYTLRETPLGGIPTEKQVATTAAMLQEQISMTGNDVVLVELLPRVSGASASSQLAE